MPSPSPSISSQRLEHILPLMTADSDNFVAEMVLKEIGATFAERRLDDRPAHSVVRSDAGRAPAWRSQEFASRTVQGFRVSTASRSGALRRHPPRREQRIRRFGDAFVSSLVGCRSLRNAEGTTRHAPDPRPRPCEDRDDEPRLRPSPGSCGNRLRLRDSPQRLARCRYWSARAAQDRFVTVLASAPQQDARDRLQPAQARRALLPSAPSSRALLRRRRRSSSSRPSPSPSRPTPRARLCASSRVQRSSVPVMTYCVPVSGPSAGCPRRASLQLRARARAALGRAPGSPDRANHSAIELGAVGPIPSTSSSSSCVAAISALDRSRSGARGSARDHPADLRDVQAEEDARERLLLRALDRRRSRASRRSRRSPRARASCSAVSR